jgi:hypothetical protein
MPKLIEIGPIQKLPARLAIKVGDVLRLRATGARVPSLTSALEIIGFYNSGVIGDNGQVLTPIGAPNTVLIIGRHPGKVMLEVVTGDPWSNVKTTKLQVDIEE